jgi:hypothetical protein
LILPVMYFLYTFFRICVERMERRTVVAMQ